MNWDAVGAIGVRSVLHYAVLSVVVARVDNEKFYNLLGWWFMLVTLVWALIVRRFLL